MNHLKWMGHSATIFDIQKNLRHDLDSCEVTLAAKGNAVRAHRFVLSSCSDMIRSILADVPIGQEATIMVPDIKGGLLDSVLEFVYLGETSLTSNNLSEFLEAINILGIKSAISFECNTVTLASGGGGGGSVSVGGGGGVGGVSVGGGTTTTIPLKSLSELNMVQEELIEQDKLEAQNVVTDQQNSSRELGFIDVYSEPQHKITYSIEHMPGTASASEYILTENSGTYTLTQNAKIENTSTSDSEKMGDIEEDDANDSTIIEEYSSGDPIIEISDHSGAASVTTSTVASPTVIQIKPKIKAIKIKATSSNGPIQQQQQQQQQHQQQQQQHHQQHQQHHQQHHQQEEQQQQHQHQHQHEESLDTSGMENSEDPISVLKIENYESFNDNRNDSALEMAVQAVINEGMSLQKAAQKFELSKTVLWRRVRKHPNYMKTARCNPVLNMAHERLKSGDSLKNISRELDIPMSTLHRYKVRLAQQGRLPDYITFKKRDANSKDALKLKLAKAVQACIHEGMSQNHAANLYDIPKSTLWRHLQKRVAEAELQHAEAEGDSEPETIKEEVILS